MFNKHNTKSGMSLIEVVVASAIFAGLAFVASRMMDSSMQLQRHTMVKDILRSKAEVSLNWIMEQFQDITEESIVSAEDTDGNPVPDTSNFTDAAFVRYKRVTAVIEEADGIYTRQYSTKEYSMGLKMADGETRDGVDNNNNGLVDEGVVVFKEYADGTVANSAGKVVKIITHDVMKEYDRDPDPVTEDKVQGFSVTCEADDAAAPSKWMIRVGLALERIDPAGRFQTVGGVHRKTTKVYYKTTTIALYK